jgi:hypothetical protein
LTVRFLLTVACVAALAPVAGAESAAARRFDCMRSISSAKATEILRVKSRVVAGGGGLDDCGINARGREHLTVTGYVVKRSFFDRLRRTTRSGTRTTDHGIRVEYKQTALKGFGGPAFKLETRSHFDATAKPEIVRSVFVYKHGRMLRPVTTGRDAGKLATLNQLVRHSRVAAKRL